MTAPRKASDLAFMALLVVTLVVYLIDIQLIFLGTPIERTMGIAQKIFYFHVPSAYCMYIGAGACFLGSAAYLYSPNKKSDAFARAGAETAVAFGFIVLATGTALGGEGVGPLLDLGSAPHHLAPERHDLRGLRRATRFCGRRGG